MTLEEFYKATEGMPKDAEIWADVKNDFGIMLSTIKEVKYFDNDNFIYLC